MENLIDKHDIIFHRGGKKMGEVLFKKWIEEEDIDLQIAFIHYGIEGILGEFELWLDRNKYIVQEKESAVEVDAESRCPECGETEPDLHCSRCGHSWYRTT